MKAELREQMREEAKRHSAEERAGASRQICERIRQHPLWRKAESVLLFVPTTHEPDISALMKEGKRVSLPAFNKKLGQYEARELKGDLVLGRFGILEPHSACSLSGALDLVLAPGVAFAVDGSRLGRGKGYYDRLLAELKAVKIGVCFDWQLVPDIPNDAHDVKMDHILTPNSLT
jgi:5-formyltetrahydrofolate cyclo-ligase